MPTGTVHFLSRQRIAGGGTGSESERRDKSVVRFLVMEGANAAVVQQEARHRVGPPTRTSARQPSGRQRSTPGDALRLTIRDDLKDRIPPGEAGRDFVAVIKAVTWATLRHKFNGQEVLPEAWMESIVFTGEDRSHIRISFNVAGRPWEGYTLVMLGKNVTRAHELETHEIVR
jgi:hypothetical protein